MKFKVWEAGLEDELKAWHEWISAKGKLYEKPNRLKNILIPLIGDKKEVKIANLGSGPVSLIGDHHQNVLVLGPFSFVQNIQSPFSVMSIFHLCKPR